MMLPALVAILGSFIFITAYADVWIPDNEFAGYFDSSGIYTVVGAVKNTESYAVTPTVEILVNDGGKTVLASHTLPTVFPNKDIPFRIHMPQVRSHNVVLESPSIKFVKDETKMPSNIQIIYDKTLVKHEDGHLTGKIINQGNRTEYNIKVYALIHASDHSVIDVGKNIEKIEKIETGQTVDFTMYPDPLVSSEVSYYSCFAIGDETIVPLYAMRGEERFDFRYDSTASFSVVGFDSTGSSLSIYGINSFKVPTYVNFEFPRTSDSEKFDVFVNEKPIKFIQSLDEEGNWHVAFDVDGASQNNILISGFKSTNNVQQEQTDLTSDTQGYLTLLIIPAAAAIGASLYLRQRKLKAKA